MSDHPKHLSFSQLNTLRSCGERYRLTRIWNVPETPSFAQAGGSAVHSWTEDWDMAILGVGEGLIPEPDAFESYMTSALADLEERSGIDRKDFKATGRASKDWPNKENLDWWLHHGPVMCKRWVTWRNTAPLDIWIVPTGEPAIELEFTVDLGGTSVRGYIDRVFEDHRTGTLVVVDLKSGAEVPDDGQLGIYKIALQKKYGVDLPILYGAYWYARTGSTSEFKGLGAWTEARATWEYGMAAARRERGDFQPRLSRDCSWCGVRDYCVYQGGDMSGSITPPWEEDRVG